MDPPDSAGSGAAKRGDRPVARRIDHLVLCVDDLDGAAAFYEKLGFQVGARNRHPWGTLNRLVQFRTSFLELITVGADGDQIVPHAPGRFSFGAFVRDYQHVRQGLAMLVLDSRDAAADAETFRNAGIGDFQPFSFGRKARRPDGTQTEVGFTLAFATNPAAPQAGFFTCQQHFPENFWNPAFQSHDNGAVNIAGVVLSAPEPADQHAFLTAFTGAAPQAGEGDLWRLDEGWIAVERQDGGAAHLRGFSIAVPDPSRVAERLAKEGIAASADGSDIVVSAADAFGAQIRFTPA